MIVFRLSFSRLVNEPKARQFYKSLCQSGHKAVVKISIIIVMLSRIVSVRDLSRLFYSFIKNAKKTLAVEKNTAVVGPAVEYSHCEREVVGLIHDRAIPKMLQKMVPDAPILMLSI